MLPSRHHGCRWSQATVRGHEVVTLENRNLRVAVLPGLGADVVEFVHKPTDTDFLFRSPWPLRPPGGPVPPNAGPAAAFLRRYHGGWQELFPLCGDAANVGGVPVGVHGEVCQLPWGWHVEVDEPDAVTVTFEVETLLAPFRLRRSMSLRADQPTLFIDESAQNLGVSEIDVMWGHHPAFGAPFLRAGCIIDTDARTILTSSHHHDSASRLKADQRSSWPMALGVDGEPIDLSVVGGPELAAQDWAYLTDFDEGWYAITEPESGVGFALRWPAQVLPYALHWQNYAARSAPWHGRAYTVALEPQTTFPANYERGAPLLRLPAGGAATLTLCASAYQRTGRVRHVAADGRIS